MKITTEEWWETYRVQCADGIHLIIERNDSQPIEADWDTIQMIKNDMLGENVYAIEIYPASSNVVNEINRRHLWVVDPEFVQSFDLSRRGSK